LSGPDDRILTNTRYLLDTDRKRMSEGRCFSFYPGTCCMQTSGHSSIFVYVALWALQYRSHAGWLSGLNLPAQQLDTPIRPLHFQGLEPTSFRTFDRILTNARYLSILHRFELHRLSSTGTKLLFQVIKKQSSSPNTDRKHMSGHDRC